MADVYNYVAETGLITVDAGVILTQVSEEYKNVFGQDLAVPTDTSPESASTPQGALIVSEALARIAVANNNVAIANQINPNIAGGIFLDALLALLGFQRRNGTPSLVLCTLQGVEGTIIPSGALVAVEGTGVLFESVFTQTIPSGGTLTDALFQSVDNGQIPAPANKLTVIKSAILGWESCTNPNEATLGQDTQSDVQVRLERNNVLAIQGASVAEAITSGVSAVSGVKSLSFRENPQSAPDTIDSVLMPANSIYACVDGGTNEDVAEALVSKKSAGAAYANTTNAITVISCGTTTSSPTVTMVSTTGLASWMLVTGTGIPADTYIITVDNGTDITISQSATATATNNLSFYTQGIPVSQSVTVPFSGQVMNVFFDRPTEIFIRVNISVIATTPIADVSAAVKAAILSYANGEIDGMAGLTVGQDVSSFELSGAVNILYPTIFVTACTIAIAPGTPTSSVLIPIAIYQIAKINSSDIVVTVL